nr:hypothetical protein [Angustibacter aerolatus]
MAAAHDAASFLAAVDAHAPDVAVVDVRMPPTHTDEGVVAAVEARRRRPGLAILVLSAYVEQRFATEPAGRRRGRARLPAEGAGGPGRGVPRRAAPGRGRRHRHRPRGRRPACSPARGRTTRSTGSARASARCSR